MQQNRTILAVDDDNFTDIAIRYTQNAENAFLLAELNGMNVDDIIASGTEILIPAKSEAPVIFVQKKVTEIEPTTSALLELQKKHSATVATAQQLGHVRSGSQIRVNEDGTMEVMVGVAGIQGEKGDKGDTGLPGEKGDTGTNGIDGREIELQKTASYVQWRYLGETSWTNLIALVDLKGAKGDTGTNGIDGTDGINGTNGIDGREIELQKTASYVQWRHLGETSWTNLIALVDLKGAKGDTGAKGDKPAHNWSGTSLRFENPNGSYGSYVNLRGPQGIPGSSGLDLPAATPSDVNNGIIEGCYISPLALAHSRYFKNNEITTITNKTIGDRLLFRDDMSHVLTEGNPVISISPNQMQHQNIYIPYLEYGFDTLVLKLEAPIGIGHFQIILKSEKTIFTKIECEDAMHQFWKDDIHATVEEKTVRMYSIYFDGSFLYIEDKFFGDLH